MTSMRNKKIVYYILLIIIITTAFLLLTGSDLLLAALLRDPYIPFGNLLSWLALISITGILKMSPYLFSQLIWSGNWFNRVSHILFIGALLWAPICVILAGNFSNSFSGRNALQGGQMAMKTFWIYSISLASISIMLLIIVYIRLLLLNFKHS